MESELAFICRTAIEAGRQLDLTGCYHEIEGQHAYEVCNYYPLLAGLALTQGMTQYLDVGTRYGGSVLSVRKALENRPGNIRLITIDIIDRNSEELPKYPDIVRLFGDSINPQIVHTVHQNFDPPVDMIYLDAVHTYEHTKANVDLYAASLNPKFLVMDDIFLNDSMKKLWSEMAERFQPDRIYDASQLTTRIHCGIGVIAWRNA
jgi:cephalosporin hydroxylase